MKYLVNRETKEHRLYTEGDYNRLGHIHGKWDVVEADEEGWIPWNGGECPLPASNQAEVKLQDGKQGRFDSIPLMTHRSWQKWNCGGDIIAYRPILETAENQLNKGSFSSSEAAPGGIAVSSLSVFDRLKSAIAASESIPAIIAEIDALLPEGYCVAKRSTVNESHIEGIGGVILTSQPAEDMSDWRNWREGDLVEAIETYKDSYIQGDTYKIRRVFGGTIYTEFDAKGSAHNGWAPRFFRFHSRPAKVAE